jgi:signal peptide peptidase SppA
MNRMWEQVRDTDLNELRAANKAEQGEPKPPYSVRDGVATIGVSGPLSKYETSFQALLGGTSTLRVREAIRTANADPSVRAILLHIESPGGTVGGTSELYDAVMASRKPVHSHIEDLGASAALWIASASKSITANKSAMVGSIGTYTAIEDTSGAYEKSGVKVHVISSGGVKGGGVDGAPVSDAYIEETQKRIDAITDLFVDAVAKGRGLSKSKVKGMADGRIHLAAAAKDMGLIDRIASLDEAHFSIARTAMNEDQVKVAEALVASTIQENETLKERLAKAEAAGAEVSAKLAAIERTAKLAAVTAKLADLKLPAQAGLAEALLTIEEKAPEAYVVLDKQIAAWAAQTDTAALFSEVGTQESGKGVNVNDAAEFRAAADALVSAKKAPNRAEAMKTILREQAQGGN